ncbi:MAG: hypothetical protein D3916_02000 [Candidatus Electrothrix sp. MAN1_4]|nr:hypothetical protein [Candidatus Electrothrix sp. MAN1_4]
MLISLLRYSLLLLTLCICIFITTGTTHPSYAGQTRPLSLTLPITTLHQTLKNLLPLPLKQQNRNRYFQGTLVVESISKLAVQQKGIIAVQGRLRGRNIAVNAKVGTQSIQIKLGEVVLPVSCDIALRYDRQHKILFLKPKFSQQARNHDPAAASLGPLLDNLSREYALPLDTLAPLAGTLGDTPIFVQLEPVDIQLGKDALVVQFLPHASTTRPGSKTRR